jgi:hypothetical protein
MLPLYLSHHEGLHPDDSCSFQAHLLIAIRDDFSSDKLRYLGVGVYASWLFSRFYDKATCRDQIKEWILKEKKKILTTLLPVGAITIV